MSGAARKLIGFIFIILLCCINLAFTSDNDLYLDSNKNYYLSWNSGGDQIQFVARVKTSGYVGLGVSPTNSTNNADMCIGGVKNGTSYFWDYHWKTGEGPMRDDQLNWNLTSATDINGTTTLQFWRYLITDDNLNDMNITDSDLFLLWAYGDTDEIVYKTDTHGSKHINLLNYNQSNPTVTTPKSNPTVTTSTSNPTVTTSTPSNGSERNDPVPVSYWGALVLFVVAMFNMFV